MQKLSLTLFTALSIYHQSATAYEIHEWGTFTSISGSDGNLLNGMHLEEEKLPHFVHALDGMQNRGPRNMKGFFRPLKNVTIKMETPVIYFYSDKPFTADVRVEFNGGSISQWYPQRSGGETVSKPATLNFFNSSLLPPYKPISEETFHKVGGIDFANKRTGSIEWRVKVLEPNTNRGLIFKPAETMNWVKPRNLCVNKSIKWGV